MAVGAATTLGVLLGVGSAARGLRRRAGRSSRLPWDEGLDVLGTVAFVFAAGTALAVGLGFLLRNTAGALVTVFLLMLLLPMLLPQFGYAVDVRARARSCPGPARRSSCSARCRG